VIGPSGDADQGRERKSSLCSRQAEENEVRSGPGPSGKGKGLDGVGNSSTVGLLGGGTAVYEVTCRSDNGSPSKTNKDPPCNVLDVHLQSPDKPQFSAHFALSEVAPTSFARRICDGRQPHRSAYAVA
jgi:hypothetical protein